MKTNWTEVKCCICGKPLYNGHRNEDEFDDKMKSEYFGNNPWPVVKDEDARCCDECNWTKVLPARLALMK